MRTASLDAGTPGRRRSVYSSNQTHEIRLRRFLSRKGTFSCASVQEVAWVRLHEFSGRSEGAVVGRNTYGHPAPGTFAALRAAVPVVRRTDRDGTVRLRVEGTHMRLEEAR
jgi:hypothetical protein